MSKQILLCVETNKKARTDYLYIVATIKKYYIDDRKIIQRPIFLDSKTKYNAKDKVKEINKAIKEFSGETKVIYFIDVDDYNISAETQTLFDNIKHYCEEHEYEFVFFYKDVEDVYLGSSVRDDEKVKRAEEFKRKKLIENVKEENLRSDTFRKHTSNILRILDLYWVKKN